jgi:hypothetical protein
MLEFPKTGEARLNLFGSFRGNADRELQQLLGLSGIAENLCDLFESFGGRPMIQTAIDEGSKLRRRPVTVSQQFGVMLSRHFDQDLHRSKISLLLQMSNFFCVKELSEAEASAIEKLSENLNVSIIFWSRESSSRLSASNRSAADDH